MTVIFQGSPRYALWARENSVWAATSGLDDLDAVVAAATQAAAYLAPEAR